MCALAEVSVWIVNVKVDTQYRDLGEYVASNTHTHTSSSFFLFPISRSRFFCLNLLLNSLIISPLHKYQFSYPYTHLSILSPHLNVSTHDNVK